MNERSQLVRSLIREQLMLNRRHRKLVTVTKWEPVPLPKKAFAMSVHIGKPHTTTSSMLGQADHRRASMKSLSSTCTEQPGRSSDGGKLRSATQSCISMSPFPCEPRYPHTTENSAKNSTAASQNTHLKPRARVRYSKK